MHSTVIWPALVFLAGAAASTPAIEDAGNRSLLYWVVIPTLLMGFAAMCSHAAGL